MSAEPKFHKSRDIKFLALVTLCHFMTDSYSSCLAPLWPSIRAKFGLTLTETSFLLTCFLFSASLLQPVYGAISDKILWRGNIIVGPLIAAVFIGAIGLYPSVGWVIAGAMFGGAGIALFHPTSSTLVGNLPVTRKALAMSFFISGGTLGFAFGPWLISQIVHTWGLGATWLITIPGVILVSSIAVVMRKFPKPKHTDFKNWQEPDDLKSFLKNPVMLLLAVVLCRSLAAITFQNFVPMWLENEGWDIVEYGQLLTLFLLFGSVGGFTGGYLSDRIGRKPIVLGAQFLSMPCYWGVLYFEGPLQTLSAILAGFFTLSFTSVSVIYAQELAPRNRGTASALMTGMGWGLAGLFMTPLGRLAEVIGIPNTIFAVSCLMLPAAVMAFFLPETHHVRTRETIPPISPADEPFGI